MSQSPVAGSAARNQFGTFAVRYPSAAQQKFVARLARTKVLTAELTAETDQVAAGTLNLKATTRLIDALLALPDADVAARPVARPASDKQTSLIGRLAAERQWVPVGDYTTDATASDAVRWIDAVLLGDAVETWQASKAIDHLFASPKQERPVAAAAAELEAGMYRAFGGELVRVYLGRQSGRMLAKRVVGSPEEGYSFEYMGAASRFVTADERMTLEEAKEWGRITGTCCVCAAHLDDPTSVAAGIGPVCAKRV